MSRFREEYYATRSYKAFVRRAGNPKAAAEADERARRAKYFKKSLSVRKAIDQATQARLSGF